MAAPPSIALAVRVAGLIGRSGLGTLPDLFNRRPGGETGAFNPRRSILMADFKRFDNATDNKDGKIAEKSSNGTFFVDYKRADDLRRFMTPNGKIQSRKKTGLTAREQRMVAQAIKRARYMALLPYTSATL